MNLIEVTESQTGATVTINLDRVEAIYDTSDTMFVFSNHNIVAKESYEEIKSLLKQM